MDDMNDSERRDDDVRCDIDEAREYACRAVAATLDMLDDCADGDMCEVYHMLAAVLRNPEVLL